MRMRLSIGQISLVLGLHYRDAGSGSSTEQYAAQRILQRVEGMIYLV